MQKAARKIMKSVKFPNGLIQMAGNLHLPQDFDCTRQYPAIACVHPGGGVKEQTAGLYAQELAQRGFVALAFDASFQGESSGEPRFFEDPNLRVGDVRSAIDYMTTLAFVDSSHIGVFGIGAGGGYAISAAIGDRRIKAVGGVSIVNIGEMFRHGWNGMTDIALLEGGSAQRTAQAAGGATSYMSFAPRSVESVEDRGLREAYDYYRTPRGRHCNTSSQFTTSSLPQLLTYDAFHLADLFLTQPLQLVAGSEAGSLSFSTAILEVAASRQKGLHIVDGATHTSLYDTPVQMEEALSKLAPFYLQHLQASEPVSHR